MATFEDFEKLDIRVGKIIEVEDFPEAKKPSYKLKIDFGGILELKNLVLNLLKIILKKTFKGNQFFVW